MKEEIIKKDDSVDRVNSRLINAHPLKGFKSSVNILKQTELKKSRERKRINETNKISKYIKEVHNRK